MGFEDVLRNLNSADDAAEAARVKAVEEDDRILAEHGAAAIRQISSDLAKAVELLRRENVDSKPVIGASEIYYGFAGPEIFRGTRLMGSVWASSNFAILDINGGVLTERLRYIDNPGGSTRFKGSRTEKQFNEQKWRAKMFKDLGIEEHKEAMVISRNHVFPGVDENVLVAVSPLSWINNGYWTVKDFSRYSERLEWHDANQGGVLFGVDQSGTTYVGQYDLGHGTDSTPRLYMGRFDELLARLVHSLTT